MDRTGSDLRPPMKVMSVASGLFRDRKGDSMVGEDENGNRCLMAGVYVQLFNSRIHAPVLFPRSIPGRWSHRWAE